ncbi:MAG: DivIVA domain-containing protein [Deltaproteobacteria bacterium]|nr:DivIVA domain-containing protein [Deltaproteobacteria bacterium]MCL5793044.1 DivIVA domain-containing protein [Deltaproteobacteria bacterium]
MKLTPLDIQQQRYRKTFRGYDVREVDAFMELVKNEMEEVVTENNDLTQKLKEKTDSLQEYKEREQTIKETMLTAQQLKNDISANAHKEAEIIIAEAKIKAEELINNAQNRYMEIINELKELRRQKIQLEASLRAILETHLKMLETEVIKEEHVIDEKISIIAGKSKISNGKQS